MSADRCQVEIDLTENVPSVGATKHSYGEDGRYRYVLKIANGSGSTVMLTLCEEGCTVLLRVLSEVG